MFHKQGVLMSNDILMEQSDELVVKSLQNYYDICSKPDKIDCSDDIIEPDEDLLWAIRRVLEEYMGRDEYDRWKNENNL
jgi:hypothetical protein